MFNRFNRTPTCDRQTDRHNAGAYEYATASYPLYWSFAFRFMHHASLAGTGAHSVTTRSWLALTNWFYRTASSQSRITRLLLHTSQTRHPWLTVISPQLGCKVLRSACLSVCLSTRVSQIQRVQISPIFNSSSSSSSNFIDMNRMDRETKHINVKRLD